MVALSARVWRRARTWRWNNPWLWEGEFADARAPEGAGRHVVFVSVPKARAIGINRGHAVIAPAAGRTGLGPCAIGHYGFSLHEEVWRIGGKTSGITNTWEYGAARCRVTDGRVSVCIDSYRRHPSE